MGRASRGADELFYGDSLDSADILSYDLRLDPSGAYIQYGSGPEWTEEIKQEIGAYRRKEITGASDLSAEEFLLLFVDNPDIYNMQATWQNKRATRFGLWILHQEKDEEGNWQTTLLDKRSSAKAARRHFTLSVTSDDQERS